MPTTIDDDHWGVAWLKPLLEAPRRRLPPENVSAPLTQPLGGWIIEENTKLGNFVLTPTGAGSTQELFGLGVPQEDAEGLPVAQFRGTRVKLIFRFFVRHFCTVQPTLAPVSARRVGGVGRSIELRGAASNEARRLCWASTHPTSLSHDCCLPIQIWLINVRQFPWFIAILIDSAEGQWCLINLVQPHQNRTNLSNDEEQTKMWFKVGKLLRSCRTI